MLVHDEVSSKGTSNIIKEFENNYPNIIKPIYQKENQYSKDVGIGLLFRYPRIKGKYVAFCEGDDYWTDMNKLQLCTDFLGKHNNYGAVLHATFF